MAPKPKPTKADRPKKQKVSKPKRQILEKQLKAIVYEIIFWRDGQACVQHNQGGCGGKLVWGHYIAQGQSAWLRNDLGNVFVQCDNHNLRDFRGDKSYATWFMAMFGVKAAQAMDAVKAEHSGKNKQSIPELEEMLAHYDDLFQNRYYVGLDKESLIEAGYYGEIIKANYK